MDLQTAHNLEMLKQLGELSQVASGLEQFVSLFINSTIPTLLSDLALAGPEVFMDPLVVLLRVHELLGLTEEGRSFRARFLIPESDIHNLMGQSSSIPRSRFPGPGVPLGEDEIV
jgi:hypothetical protein